jgi:hypothetical protein
VIVIYLLSILISLFSPNLSRLHPLPPSGIVPGGQSTALRRRCAPKGFAIYGATIYFKHSRRNAVLCPPIADFPNKG